MILTGGADPFLYENQLADVGDVVDELGKKYGRLVPVRGRELARPKSGWRAVPWFWISFPATYNMAHFKKAGLEYPKTWAELLQHGKILKKQGNPVGIAISHCADANTTYWSIAWCARRQGAGGRRQDAGHQLRQDRAGDRVLQGALPGRDGSRGPVLGRRLQQSLHPLRQVLLDPQPDQPLQRRPQGEDADRRRHQPPPEPGRPRRHALGAAHQLDRRLEVLQERRRWPRTSSSSSSRRRTTTPGSWPRNAFNHPPLRHLADHPIWARNPKFAMLPKEAEFAHPRGWPAKPNDAVGRIEVNYVLPDMVAKAVNGMPTKRAMEWAQDQVAQAVKGQLKASG